MFYYKRPHRFTSCCCFLCLQKMKVTTNSKEKIGTIKQKWSLWCKLVIKNAFDQPCLIIKGSWSTPHFRCRLFKYDNFRIFNNDGAKVGQIIKEKIEQVGNDKDLYTLHFPKSTSIEIKSLLIGTVFLIVIINLELPFIWLLLLHIFFFRITCIIVKNGQRVNNWGIKRTS